MRPICPKGEIVLTIKVAVLLSADGMCFMCKILQVNPQSPDQRVLEQAAEIMRQGGIIAFPTETFYGLAADHQKTEALVRLAELKAREGSKPFPLILSSRNEVFVLCEQVNEAAKELMARYWPGPLTLVLPARASLPPQLRSVQGGVGVRLSPHPVAMGLAKVLGRAITATSANLATCPPAKQLADLQQEMHCKLDLLLDAGMCPAVTPSTVLDLMGPVPVVLRPGAIKKQSDWQIAHR